MTARLILLLLHCYLNMNNISRLTSNVIRNNSLANAVSFLYSLNYTHKAPFTNKK